MNEMRITQVEKVSFCECICNAKIEFPLTKEISFVRIRGFRKSWEIEILDVEAAAAADAIIYLFKMEMKIWIFVWRFATNLCVTTTITFRFDAMQKWKQKTTSQWRRQTSNKREESPTIKMNEWNDLWNKYEVKCYHHVPVRFSFSRKCYSIFHSTCHFQFSTHVCCSCLSSSLQLPPLSPSFATFDVQIDRRKKKWISIRLSLPSLTQFHPMMFWSTLLLSPLPLPVDAIYYANKQQF